jgi:hypothetical protein
VIVGREIARDEYRSVNFDGLVVARVGFQLGG